MTDVPNAAADVGLLKRAYSKNVALGERAVQSDFEMIIQGYPMLTGLIRTAQLPEISRGDAVEDVGAYGQGFQQYGTIKRDGDITATAVELKDGTVIDTLKEIIDNKQYVDIEILLSGEGSEKKGYKLETCLLKVDPADLDTSNRTGPVQISINIHYNWSERI